MKCFCRRKSAQDGAALIEGLASMLALLMFVVIVLFVGVAYYNTSVMNTATQNIALGVQTQLQVCSNSAALCDNANQQIANITTGITNQTFNSLALVDRNSANAKTNLQCLPPGASTVASPANNTAWPTTTGWGYTRVRMEIPSDRFLLPGAQGFEGNSLTYGSTAIGFSYAPPTGSAGSVFQPDCQRGQDYP